MEGMNPNAHDLPDHQVMSAQGYGTLPNSALVNGTAPLQQLDLDGEIRQPQQSATMENPALVAGQAQAGNVAGGVKAPTPPPPPSGQAMGYGSTGASAASMSHDSQAGGRGDTASALATPAVPPPVMRTDVVGAVSSGTSAVDGLQGQREQSNVLAGQGVLEAQTLTPQAPQPVEVQPQFGAQPNLEGGPKAPPSMRVEIGGQGFMAQGVQWMLRRFADIGGQEVLVTQPSSQTAQTEYQTPVTPKSLFSPEQMRRFAQLEEQAPQLYTHVAGQVGQVASPPSSASLSMEAIQAEVRRQVERELEGRNRRLRELEEENRRLREENVESVAYAVPPKVKAKGFGGFLGGLFPGSGGFWANSRGSPAPPPPPPSHSQSPPPLPPLPTSQGAGYGSVANSLPPANATPFSGYPSGLGPTNPSGWQGSAHFQPAEHQTLSGYPSGLVPVVPSTSHSTSAPPMLNSNLSGYPSGLVPGVPSGFPPSAHEHSAQNPNPSGYPSGLGPWGVPSGFSAPEREQAAQAQGPSGYPSGLAPPSDWPQPAMQQEVGNRNQSAVLPAAPIAPSPVTLPVERTGEGVESLGSNSLELLIAGMRQLQEVSMRASESPKSENVKPGITSLPTLVEPGPEAPVDFQDWVYTVSPAMQDLSENSAEWWENILLSAESYYSEYLKLDPVARLSHKPQPNEVLRQARWRRVEKRAETLVLAGLPKTVREECVAGRLTGFLAIWCRVMVIYQPGSLLERATALKCLESPGEAADAVSAAKGLRKWHRWLLRVRSVGGTPPDPTILIRALTAMCKKPLELHTEAAFRVQLARSTLRVDINPSSAKVDELYGLLLAEMENLSHSPAAPKSAKTATLAQTNVNPTTTPTPPPPKPNQTPQAKAKADTPCRNFLTDAGCSRGAKCGFSHDTSSMTRAQRGQRCFNCGSTGHRVSECTAPKPDSAQGSKGEAKGGGKGGKGGHQDNPKAKTSSEKPGGSVEGAKSSAPAPKAGGALQASAASSSTAVPTDSSKLKAMIAEAHQMLQDLKATSSGQESRSSVELPKMAMMWSDLPDIPQLPQLNFVPEKDALLDSGASHALRKPKDQEEAANAERIEVILAGDERRSLRQNAGGTILSDAPSAQTILPLGALVRELGCSVKWSRKGLTLRHPAYGVLRTQIRGGCPQLAEAEALRLISDLEQKRLERFDGQLCELQAKIEAVEGSSWEEPVCKYLTQGDRKELMVAVSRLEIPDDSVTQAMYSRVRDLSKGKEWEYLKELGLSRAKRRRLMKSNRWMVHPDDKGEAFTALGELGESFKVQARTFNEYQTHAASGLLLWAASQGKLGCVTMHVDSQEDMALCVLLWILNSFATGASMPMSLMTTPELGSQWQSMITGLAFRVVTLDGRIAVSTIPLPELEFRTRPGKENSTGAATQSRAGFAREVLRSIRRVYGKSDPGPSTAQWTEQLDRELAHNMTFHPEIHLADDGVLSCSDHCASSVSTRKAKYPKRRRIATSQQVMNGESRSGGTTTTPVLAAVDAAKLEEWRLHLAAGHQPYRKDCATCVASAATGHAHRRVAHKTPCSLSLDIAGPFKKGGKSVDGGLTYFEKDVKYVLVASYRAPLTFFRPSEKPTSEDTKLPDEEFESLGVEGQAVFEEEAEEPRLDGEEEKDEEGFLLSDDEPAKAEMRKIVGPFDEVVARAPRYMPPRRRFARLDFQESQRWYDPDAATALQFPLGYPPPLQDRWEDLVIPSFDEDCLVEHFIPIALYMNRNQDWDEHSDVVFVDQDGELEPTVVARVLRYEGHVSPARNEFWYFQVHNLLEDKEETYFILEEFSTRADTANFPPRPPNLVPPPSPFDGYEPPPRLAMMQEDVDFGEYVLSEGEEHGHSNAGKPQDQESVASWLEADLENLASVSEEVLSKEALKAKVEELSKPVPQGSVILAKALVSRKGSEVLMALQEIVVQLEQYGLFVSKVHTDRAREFLSYKRVRSWLASKGIARSFTSGIKPAANGSGESAVKWVKRRVRQLLISSKAPASQWPAAMQWAVTKQIREKLPVGDPNIPPFHAKVWFRSKRYGLQKKGQDFEPRWEEGLYACPSSTVSEGHVIIKSTGEYTTCKGIKLGVERLEEHVPLPEVEGTIDMPAKRLREKTRLASLETERAVQESEVLAEELRRLQDFSREKCQLLLRASGIEKSNKPGVRGAPESMILGGYVQGGFKGATKETLRRPHLTKFLNEFLRDHLEQQGVRDASWASLAVYHNPSVGLHRDMRNEPQSQNFVMQLTDRLEGGLWISDSTLGEPVDMLLPTGRRFKGSH